MSVTIRLARFGKKFAPSYKIVVAKTRDKRNGKFLDILGYYNPSETPVKYDMDKEKYDKWLGNGALVTDAVKKIVDGTYEYIPYKGSVKDEKSETPDKTDDKTKVEDKLYPGSAEDGNETPEEKSTRELGDRAEKVGLEKGATEEDIKTAETKAEQSTKDLKDRAEKVGLKEPAPSPTTATPATSLVIADAVAKFSACPGITTITSPRLARHCPIA